ncbi:MAG: aspartate kinase [Butyrivibrio sp.]|nr:aspartate kinase [Butyrivibrio sp.]
MVKVTKFGGSSLASAEQFRKVADIIFADPARKFVVPSAPGKRFPEDVKVTDMLYACYKAAISGRDFKSKFKEIRDRYDGIISELGLDMSLENEYEAIEAGFKGRAGRDYAASRGEFLNGIILAKYIGYEFIDAADVVFFNEDGTFNLEMTNASLRDRLVNVEKAVIPGFYGSTPNDTIKTFSRGGSDITGSIVAAAVKADLYENWTDVSGFMIADPRIIENPAAINTITYKELRELSYMGATVLHEDAIFPVRREGIPINIKNTNAPDDPGTMIVESTSKKPEHIITGIAGKKGFSAVNIEKDMMNSEIGFGRKVLEQFEKQGLSFEHMPSGIDTMTIIVHQDEFVEKEQEVLAGIHRNVSPDSVEIEAGLALIAVVGRGMKSVKGTALKIFEALYNSNVNVKMIDQGSSELNIIIGVLEEEFETAFRAIYNAFVK